VAKELREEAIDRMVAAFGPCGAEACIPGCSCRMYYGMAFDIVAPMAILSEAKWLTGAHANSEGRGFTNQYRDGFEAAAGWVRFHGQHPDLVKGRTVTDRETEMAAVIDKQVAEEELLDALEDVIRQACWTDGNEELDSMALSAYAHGLKVLAKHDRVQIIHEAGRRVIALPVTFTKEG
jgi:hypothetical protein